MIQTIPVSAFMKYLGTLEKSWKGAKTAFRSYIWDLGGFDNMTRQDLIDCAYSFATIYGEGSAAMATEFYNAVAILENAPVPPAVPAETVSYDEVAKTINGILKDTTSEAIIENAVSLMVKKTGMKTIIENARRDNAQIAYIPHGDTCAFCITLGSRGWLDANSTELATKDGEPIHIHANCDCTYGVRFSDNLKYKGYEPAEYERMYYDAPLREGEKPNSKNRINALRRQAYQKNKDKINAQKRDRYEKTKELNSSKAEEIDVN